MLSLRARLASLKLTVTLCPLLCAFHSQDEAKLLYRGSRDGWTYKDWVAKCADQSNTLTLIKVSQRWPRISTRRVCTARSCTCVMMLTEVGTRRS